MNERQSDQVLLDAIVAFVTLHPHPDVQRFKEAVENWGRDWRGAPATHLPAADYLTGALPGANAETRDLLRLFQEAGPRLRWEQSYTKSDEAIGEDMLAGYGFADLIGTQGPFLSSRVRAGIGIWGPDIDYPPHRHQAEEVYVILAGSALFQRGQVLGERRTTGEVVYIPSMLRHGFRSEEEPFVVFYLWQGDNLREKSAFD